MGVQQSTVGNLLLNSLDPSDYALFEPHLERTAMPVRLMMHVRGEPTEYIYFPEGGLVSIVAVGTGGKLHEIGVFGREGMSSTSIVLRTDRSPHEIFVQIAGPSVLRMRADALREAIQQSESLNQRLLWYVQAMMVQVANATTSAAVATVDRRLARWLLMCHDRIDGNELRITHEFMAMMLGARRASVTEALHLLEGQNVIEGRRGAITVTDRHGLEAIAGDAYGLPEAEYERLIGQRLRLDKAA